MLGRSHFVQGAAQHFTFFSSSPRYSPQYISQFVFLSRVEEVAHLQHIGKIFLANVEKSFIAATYCYFNWVIGDLRKLNP